MKTSVSAMLVSVRNVDVAMREVSYGVTPDGEGAFIWLLFACRMCAGCGCYTFLFRWF